MKQPVGSERGLTMTTTERVCERIGFGLFVVAGLLMVALVVAIGMAA